MDDVAQSLFYSDDPESLGAAVIEGVLFDFDVVDAVPQRFLFYHYLPTGTGRYIALRALNLSNAATVLEWRGSIPTPSSSITNCGHHATAGFLAALDRGLWTNALPLGGNAQAAVFYQLLAAGDLFNGICEFRVTSGGPVKLSLVVVRDRSRIATVASSGGGLGSDSFGRIGKFDISKRAPIACTFTAGGAPVLASRLGQAQLPNLDTTRSTQPFKGEYAMVTLIDAQLTNNSGVAVDVALYESAHGGPSTASYLIDGAQVESGLMACKIPPPSGYIIPRYKVSVYHLAPGSTTRTQIYTIPDNASSSPVVLTFDASDSSPNPGMSGGIIQINPIPSPSRVT